MRKTGLYTMVKCVSKFSPGTPTRSNFLDPPLGLGWLHSCELTRKLRHWNSSGYLHHMNWNLICHAKIQILCLENENSLMIMEWKYTSMEFIVKLHHVDSNIIHHENIQITFLEYVHENSLQLIAWKNISLEIIGKNYTRSKILSHEKVSATHMP